MTTATNYPDGSVLTSSALTPAQINVIMQTLTYGMIGLPTPPPTSWQPVQCSWQTQGQPMTITPATQDECYLTCVPVDEDYTRIRDASWGTTAPVAQEWEYTRAWRVAWVLYGPNATDRARMIRSALYMDYFNDQLNLSALYPVSDPPEIQRVPEQINMQWYDRADFWIMLYEQVNETLTFPTGNIVTSVEVKLNADDLGQTADFTVTKP
jgi:hypothetical protein